MSTRGSTRECSLQNVALSMIKLRCPSVLEEINSGVYTYNLPTEKKNGTNTKLLINKNARHTLYTLCNQSHLSEIYAQSQIQTKYLIAMKAGELITSRHGDAVLIGEGYDRSRNDLHLDLSGTDGCVYLLSPNVRHISVTKATQDEKKI